MTKALDYFDEFEFGPDDERKADIDAVRRGFCQWTNADNGVCVPANQTRPSLTAGFYEIARSQTLGTYFKRIKFGTEELIEFPDSHCDEVVKDIKLFWKLKGKYKAIGQVYKRGMLLTGVPGGGKSSAIKLIVSDIIKNDGIAIKFTEATLFNEGMAILRRIEPDRQVVVLMEDLDGLIQDGIESEILNVLDGVSSSENIVFLATTNHPDKLLGNVINRPSRFDRVFDFKAPNKETRAIYINHLYKKFLSSNEDINLDTERMVRETDGFTIAHLKELFISVAIFEYSYTETLDKLKGMKVRPKEDDGTEEGGGKIGF